ncbi:DUF6236 family protein [Acinetobacter baumannii]|nr:DUF6236 family protein [Acinetobacter baumannii]
MGEAKRRGSFEDRKKQARKHLTRGIITYPGTVSIKDGSFNLDSLLTENDMYYFAMYWDKILIPSGMVRVDLACDRAFESNGVLEKISTIRYPPDSSCLTEDGKSIDGIKHEIWVFGELAKQKINARGEVWDINHVDSDPIYMDQHSRKTNTIRLRATEVLPYPVITEKYNIEDLLNFKQRRADELAALHDSMDNLVKRIYDEPLHALKEKEIKRFENAVLELDKTLIERFKITNKSDWELNLNLDTSNLIEKASAIGIAAAADHALSPFPIFTAAATAAVSLISLSKKYGITFNQYARDDIKLEYISRAKAEQIIP